jgi:hypothetical protein
MIFNPAGVTFEYEELLIPICRYFCGIVAPFMEVPTGISKILTNEAVPLIFAIELIVPPVTLVNCDGSIYVKPFEETTEDIICTSFVFTNVMPVKIGCEVLVTVKFVWVAS